MGRSTSQGSAVAFAGRIYLPGDVASDGVISNELVAESATETLARSSRSSRSSPLANMDGYVTVATYQLPHVSRDDARVAETEGESCDLRPTGARCSPA